MCLDEPEGDLRRGAGISDAEHDLVADHLHHAPAALWNVLIGHLLETVDHGRQLVLGQLLAHGGKADQIHETDDEGTALFHLAGRCGHDTEQGCQQVPAPHVTEQWLQLWQERAEAAGDEVGLHFVGDVGLHQHSQVGTARDLRLGDSRERLPGHAGELQQHPLVCALLLEQPADPAQHLDVRVGEDSFVIGHRRKSERAPQTAGLLEVDARLRRHLGPGELRVTEKGACE